HIVRSDEMKKSSKARKDDITLATIHAIKGMEAKVVFIVGATINFFPCKGSEHPIIDMVKVEEYDKEEEERRLFYVAMSRAKNSLYLSYSGSRPTYFINSDMLGMMDAKELKVQVKKMVNTGFSGDVVGRLKSWRREVSNAMGVPAFMIMHDRTIAEVADAMPKSTDDLSRIHGFGPTKISKYGDDILEVVNG
ncbi:MAG: HRDC domain-containing protein, partial [Candidatus Aenigmarchaeota archaeon]|nr:HRDC domain-containing protein [Candidatus Aenigmarchaeota archaeon]